MRQGIISTLTGLLGTLGANERLGQMGSAKALYMTRQRLGANGQRAAPKPSRGKWAAPAPKPSI